MEDLRPYDQSKAKNNHAENQYFRHHNDTGGVHLICPGAVEIEDLFWQRMDCYLLSFIDVGISGRAQLPTHIMIRWV